MVTNRTCSIFVPVYGTSCLVRVFGADFWYVCHEHKAAGTVVAFMLSSGKLYCQLPQLLRMRMINDQLSLKQTSSYPTCNRTKRQRIPSCFARHKSSIYKGALTMVANGSYFTGAFYRSNGVMRKVTKDNKYSSVSYL